MREFSFPLFSPLAFQCPNAYNLIRYVQRICAIRGLMQRSDRIKSREEAFSYRAFQFLVIWLVWKMPRQAFSEPFRKKLTMVSILPHWLSVKKHLLFNGAV